MLHSAPSDLIGVTCYRCSARLYFQRAEAGTTVRCSECRCVLTVPAAPPLSAMRSASAEGYTLQSDPVEPQPSPPSRSQGGTNLVAITCPGCNTQLLPKASQAGQQMHCAECGAVVRVPPPLPQGTPSLPSNAAAAATAEAPPRPYLFRPLQSDRPWTQAAAAPKWTFFSGVFTIAFRGECLLRWFLFSIGLAISLSVAGLLVAMIMQGGLIGGLAAGFMTMVALWVSLWTLSYGTASFVAILGDTANGGDEIATWPDDDWREWIFQLLLIVPALGLSLASGALLGKLWGTFAAGTYVVAGMITLVIFPLVLLSSFVQNNPFQPFAATVWKSLGREVAAWVVVWGLSLLLVAPLAATLALAKALGVFVAVTIIAPYAAAAWFTYARLLGRLLWKIHQSADRDD